MEENIPKIKITEPEFDPEFQSSGLYSMFGLTLHSLSDYRCYVGIIISASDDIEIEKVTDFLKDFIPAQLDEVADLPYLQKFKFVNEKITQVLSDSLDENSYIEARLAYVLFQDDYFYVSLDEDFDLIVHRTGDQFSLRESETEIIDGSGTVVEGDRLDLCFQQNKILSWVVVNPDTLITKDQSEKPIEFTKPKVGQFEQIEVDNSDNVDIESGNVGFSADSHMDEVSDIDIKTEHSDTNTENFARISKDNTFVQKAKAYTQKSLDWSKTSLKKYYPKARIIAKNGIKSMGDAFSYIFAVVVKRRRGNLNQALPDKKKGFMIIAVVFFLVILLIFFIKSSADDNTRKQQEQNYLAQITQIETKTNDLKNKSNVTVGDTSYKSQIAQLRTELVALDTSNLKDKTNSSAKITTINATLDNLQDRVDGVGLRIDEGNVFTSFRGFINNATPTALVYKDSKLYFANPSNGTVYAIDTIDKNLMPIVTGNDGMVRPQSVAFAKNGLIVLDPGKGVFLVNVATKKATLLAGYDAIATNSIALDTFTDDSNNNFYLLQADKNEIARVRGVSGDKFAAATKYNKDALDANVQNITIIGGNVYTINNSGQMSKFNSGDKVSFSLPALEVPIGAGASIVGMEPRDVGVTYLFIADPANDRILVLDNSDANGVTKLVRQIKVAKNQPFDLKSIKAMAIEESIGKPTLYVVSSYGIFKIFVD